MDTQNKRLYTEWEIRSSQVPDIVMTAFKASAYASYRIDDIYHIETSTAEYFYIEFEDNGREEKVRIDMQGNFF